MNLKQRLLEVIEKSKIQRQLRRQWVDTLFDREFLNNFDNYMISGMNLQKLACKENHELLFRKNSKEHGIPPIFEYCELETNAERERHSDSTYAVYNFNNPDGITTIRLEISVNAKQVPESLKSLRHRNKRPKCIVDIEFFEKNSLVRDCKNQQLKDFVSEYLVDGRLTIEELEELGPLMALHDLEKLHTAFLVFEDDSFITAYLGIGNNQPYAISEKGKGIGKDRFYRYSLFDAFEQTSTTGVSGNPIQLQDGDVIFTEYASDGKEYGLFSNIGVIVRDGVNWKKAIITRAINQLDITAEANKKLGLPFISKKIQDLFPPYESYSKIFYDPLERINSFGHVNAIKFLSKKQLLGAGWQSPLNVASDLFINGYDDIYRIKPASLLLQHLIDFGEYQKIILHAASNKKLLPLNNIDIPHSKLC